MKRAGLILMRLLLLLAFIWAASHPKNFHHGCCGAVPPEAAR